MERFVKVTKNTATGKYEVDTDARLAVTANTKVPLIFLATEDYPQPDPYSYFWLPFKADGSICSPSDMSEAAWIIKWGTYGGSYREVYTTSPEGTEYPWENPRGDVNITYDCTFQVSDNALTILDDSGSPVYDGSGEMQVQEFDFGNLCVRGVSS